MLLKQSCQHAGKFDSPGMAVPVLVIVNDDEEDGEVEEEVGVEIDVDDEVDGMDTLVVNPSKAFAQT